MIMQLFSTESSRFFWRFFGTWRKDCEESLTWKIFKVRCVQRGCRLCRIVEIRLNWNRPFEMDKSEQQISLSLKRHDACLAPHFAWKFHETIQMNGAALIGLSVCLVTSLKWLRQFTEPQLFQTASFKEFSRWVRLFLVELFRFLLVGLKLLIYSESYKTVKAYTSCSHTVERNRLIGREYRLSKTNRTGNQKGFFWIFITGGTFHGSLFDYSACYPARLLRYLAH